MKKKFMLMAMLIFMIILAGIFGGSVSAQDEPVFVYAFGDGNTYQATTAQTIDLGWGWFAMTKGQSNVFVRNSSTTFRLTDGDGDVWLDLDADASRQVFATPFSVPPEEFGYECPKPELWITAWNYFIEPLPAGTYTLESSMAFDTPVNDGFHTCKAAPPPSLLTSDDDFTATVTIEVTAP